MPRLPTARSSWRRRLGLRRFFPELGLVSTPIVGAIESQKYARSRRNVSVCNELHGIFGTIGGAQRSSHPRELRAGPRVSPEAHPRCRDREMLIKTPSASIIVST